MYSDHYSRVYTRTAAQTNLSQASCLVISHFCVFLTRGSRNNPSHAASRRFIVGEITLTDKQIRLFRATWFSKRRNFARALLYYVSYMSFLPLLSPLLLNLHMTSWNMGELTCILTVYFSYVIVIHANSSRSIALQIFLILINIKLICIKMILLLFFIIWNIDQTCLPSIATNDKLCFETWSLLINPTK